MQTINCRNGFFNRKKLWEKSCNIVYFGGSVTYSNNGWRSLFHSKLCEITKQNHKEIDSTIGGNGSVSNFFFVNEKVLSYQPDFVFIDFSINDKNEGHTPFEYVEKATESIICLIRKFYPKVDICLLYMYRRGDENFYLNRNFDITAAIYEKISDKYGIPTINVSNEISIKYQNRYHEIFKDSCHPNKDGIILLGNLILDSFLYICNSEFKNLDSEINSKYIWTIGNSYKITDDMISGKFIKQEFDMRKEKIISYILDSDSKITIKFSGSCIGLCVLNGQDSGIIEYSIDNQKSKELNLFDCYCGKDYSYKHLFLSGKLENKEHELNVILLDKIPNRVVSLIPHNEWPKPKLNVYTYFYGE